MMRIQVFIRIFHQLTPVAIANQVVEVSKPLGALRDALAGTKGLHFASFRLLAAVRCVLIVQFASADETASKTDSAGQYAGR